MPSPRNQKLMVVYALDMKQRWKALIAASALGSLGTAWALAPYAVISYLESQGAKRGWEVRAKQAKLSRGSVEYVDVTAVNGAAGVSAALSSVTVRLDWLSPRSVEVVGARVSLTKRPAGRPGAPKEASRIPVRVSELSFTADGVYGNAWLRGAYVQTGPEGAYIQAAQAGAVYAGAMVVAQSMSLSKGELEADSVTVTRDYEKGTSAVKEEKAKTPGHLPVKAVRAKSLTMAMGGAKVVADQVTIDLSQLSTLDFSQTVALSFKNTKLAIRGLDNPVEATDGKLKVTRIQTQKYDALDFKASAAGVSGEVEAISKEKLGTKAVSVSGMAVKVGDTWKLAGSSVKTGSVEILGIGELSPRGWSVKAGIADAGCQDLADALPAGMAGIVPEFKFSGTFGVAVEIDKGEGKPAVRIRIRNRCRITSAPAFADVARFHHRFTRTVPGPGKEEIVIESGPGSGGWIPLDIMPKYMPKAAMTAEDPAFEVHGGFIAQAFENSAVENLLAGRFVRGGSTISMQLAKNLWLTRTKTLSRKLQELFLTTYLEQSMSKERIIELYLNVVEFGPGLYGVGPASRHYFDKPALAMSLAECAFLASILPAPKREHFNPDGTIHPGWASYLRTLMKTMLDRGLISEDDLASGLTEEVRKGGSGADHVLPGKAAEGGVDPSTWR